MTVFLATCGEDGPGGPSGAPVIGQVEFTSGPLTTNGYFGPNLPIDRVHVRIVRPPSDVLRDTTRAFDPNQNRLRFDLPILLTAAAESLDVTLELLSGTTVLFSGTRRLEARAGPPSGATPPAIPLTYSGPGSNVAQIALSPLDSILGQGDSLVMQVTGLDANQLPVPAFYVGWSSSDTTVARVNGAGVVRGRVSRGTVFIRAKTPDTQAFPSGIIESTTVTLVPDPSTLVKVGGDNQTGPIGSTLPQVLTVEVRAADNLPVPGVPVAFATSDPGASVGNPVDTTDGNGIARSPAILGTTVGPQSFTATVAGVSSVTFNATATSAPTPTWTGAVDTDWNKAGNWNTGAVPGASDSVTIPSGTANSPSLTSNADIRVLLNNGVLNMGNFTLSIDGNLRGTGTISGNPTSSLVIAAGTVLDQAAVTNLSIQGAGLAVGRNLSVSGDLSVMGSNGDLDLNGHTINLNGDFVTQSGGTLTMANAMDTLRVFGDVQFGGGSTFGRIANGVILIQGDFSQLATTSPRSFAPTGNHLDVFFGGGTQTITFATPGATSSNFETLGLANTAGGVTLASDLFLAGPVGFAPGVPRIAHGSGQTLFVAELRASNATLDNILVAANNVLLTQFDSINFINYSPAATPLTISHPGSATPFVMNDLSFGVTPTSGKYISVTDLVADANVLTLNLANPTPGASGGFVQTAGGAVVNWPFVPAGARTWTGAIDTDWFKAGNWSPATVPAPSDDVVIPPTATQPVLTGGAGVHNLTIQSGATLTANSDFDVSGNALVSGNFLGSAGILVMSTHGSSVAGNISNLEIDLPTRFESILVSGALNVSGLIEVLRGHLDVGGNTVTTADFATITDGILKMVNPSGTLVVNGNANFGGEDPTGVLTAGTIRIKGNFAQLVGVTQGSFVATGTNRVVLDGTGPQVVTFVTPAANGSRFQDLEIANTSDTVFMGSNIAVGGTLLESQASPVVIAGAGQLITANGVAMSGATFHNALVDIRGSAITQFDNITWDAFSPFVTQFTVTLPNGIFQFNNHVFTTTPSTGFYLRADDTNTGDGSVLSLSMVNPTPASPGAFVQIGGNAVVTWPAAAGGTTAWTGAVSNNWFDPANWSNGVPTATDDVDFTQPFTFPPTIQTSTSIRNLSVSSGRVIFLPIGTNLAIHGDAVIAGTISGPGTVHMVGTSGNVVAGIFPNLTISGPYTLAGTLEVHGTSLTLQSDLTVGANTITLFANLNVTGSGRLIMTHPSALVGVQGSALFDGASTVGTLTAGLLGITGDFTQAATTSSNSFTAGGSHLTLLNGAGSQVVTFGNPTVSGFQGLQYGGTGSLALGSDIRVLGAFTSVVPRVISGSGRKLTTVGISATSGTFDNVLIEVNSTLAGSLLSINNTTFLNYPSTATQLSIVHPGSPVPATFDGLTFSSTPTSGFYMSVQDQNPSDGVPLTVNVTNATPSTGSPFVQTAAGAVVNWPAGPAPATTWTGAVSTDWSNPANWSSNAVPGALDSVVIPAGGNQPSLTAPSLAGVLHLANGTLTLNGQPFAVGTNFYSTGSGRLVMTNPNDGMTVGGDATFDGASELTLMSAGALILHGDLIQLATNSPDSYHATGSHTTFFVGSTTQTISFATPGALLQEVVWSGTGDLALATTLSANGTFTSIGATPRSITSGSSQFLAVNGFSNALGGITFDNVRLFINQSTPTVLIVNDLTFINQSPTFAQLQVGHPGDASTYTFSNLTFTTVPTTGAYLSAVDLATGNGFPFTIDMVNPTPTNPGTFVQALGSVVNWPAAGGGSPVWTGAVDGNWNNAGNWSGGIPQSTSDVIIPAGAPNYPVLTTSETVTSFDLATAAQIDLAAGSLVILGDLSGSGDFVNGGPVMGGTGTIAFSGGLDGLTITGNITQASDLVVDGDVVVDGVPANFTLGGFDFDIIGNLSLINSGTMVMNDPLTHVTVSGNVLFDGGPENGLLTDGLLEVHGNFTQDNSSSTNSFRAAGTHQVLLAGSSLQTITFADSLLSFFRNLTLSNAAGVRVVGIPTVTGTLLVSPGVSVDANTLTFVGDGFNVGGNVSTGAGSLLHLGRLYVGGALTVGGTYNTTSVIFTGTGQTAPAGLPYQFLYSRGSVTFGPGTPAIQTLTVEGGTLTLANRTTVGTNVFITGGTLKPNGHTLAMSGALNVSGSGTLTMQNPLDSVITGATGAAIFGGGSTAGLLTDGVLKVGGSFTQTSGTSPTSFAASGNHKTIIGAAAVRIVNFATPATGGAGSHFGNLDVTLGSGDITLSSDMVVDGVLISQPSGTAPTIVGGGKSMTVKSLSVTRGSGTSIFLENAPLIVNEQGIARTQLFDRAAFSLYPATATLMDLTLVGSNAAPRNETFVGPNLQTSITGPGLYARLVSSNGQSVTLTISGSNDPTGGPSKSDPSFGSTVNGARIVWQ